MNQKGILKLLLTCSSDFKKLYDKIITELSSAVSVSANDASTDELYNIERDCTPSEKTKVQALLSQYGNALEGLIKQGITRAVLLCADTQDKALKSYTRMEGDEVDAWRKDTAKSFVQSRIKRDKGLNLSDRVWNYTQQTKSEFELAMSHALEDGISKGISAESLGRKVRQYLKNPDMMYRRYHTKKLMSDGTKKDVVEWRRRVIGEDGKVHFVKEDLAKVGTGVYRSARQNALRLTITETNMAYDYANCTRWANEPFVLGLRIRLSEAHPEDDICDELEGDYPKTFMWRGWHPRCMCSISPILMDRKSEEWKKLRAMSDEDYKKYQSPNLINEMPKKFKTWCDDNKDKLNAARERGKLPYFVRDNEKVVGETVGWKTKKDLIMEAAKARHDARTPEKEAMLRDYWTKKVAEGEARRRKEAIMSAAKKRQEARTQEQKDNIQARWDAFKERNRRIKNMSNNILNDALSYYDVSTNQLQKYLNANKLSLAAIEAKNIEQQIASIKKKANGFAEIFPNVHTITSKYSISEIENAYKEVEQVLKKWLTKYSYSTINKASLEHLRNKLEFEISNPTFAYSNKDIINSALSSKIKTINQEIQWNKLVKEAENLSTFKTKSSIYKKHLKNIDDAIKNGNYDELEREINNAKEKKQELLKKRTNKKVSDGTALNEEYKGGANGKDISSSVDVSKMTSEDPYRGTFTNNVARMQGFDAPAKLVSVKEFEKLENAYGDVFYRTVNPTKFKGKEMTSEEFASQLYKAKLLELNGPGGRVYGDGMYVATSVWDGDELHELTKARKRNAYNNSACYGNGEHTVSEMTWTRKPRIIKQTELSKMWQDLDDEKKALFGDSPNTYACALGYDAMYCRGPEYMVIWNRSIIAVKKR